MKKKILQNILQELRFIHFHVERQEVFYKMVHNIKEDEKNGAWIEKRNHKN